MTTTSPALPASVTSPASLTTAGSRLAGLRRRIPMVVLFAAVSFSGWTVDYVLVLILNSLTGSVLYAVVGARVVSCTLGFLLNRRLFRAAPETFWRSAGGYAAVQGGVAATSYAGIAVLTGTGAPLWLAKVLVTPRSSSSTTWLSPASSTGPRRSSPSWLRLWRRRPEGAAAAQD